jgi:UDP-N-acetylglucosamine 3-dehydrogenase
MAKLRFGLVGCGGFGKYLGRYILEIAEIAAVCDVNIEGARQTAATLDIDVPAFSDYREMIDAGGLDVIAITAANFVHAEIAVAAAGAGLHVFCEKAMARTVEECWQMVRACLDNDVKLTVGHKRRLRMSWGRMIELTDDSVLGEPLALTVTQYADMRPYAYPGTWWADPSLSGGSFCVLGVHVLDWFRAMCGNAVRVSAVNGLQQEAGFKYPDIMHATYQFESGAIATINTSFSFPLHKFREAQGPMVQCRHGGLKLVPQMEYLDLYWQRLDEDEPHHQRFPIEDDFDPAYRRELGDFVAWITDGTAPCLGWEEGLRCVELMEAGYESAKQNGTPIDLPLRPDLELN